MNNEEINKIIDNLDGCIGMFDYLITPIESNLLVSYIKELQQENQELKKQLEEYKLITIDYQELEARNKELKKQLTTYQILHRDCKVDNLKNISKIEEKENQQKEFIELLEKEIVDSKAGSSQQYYAKEHLRLFKEIIGVENENNIS